MSEQTYNQAILELAEAGLAALDASNANSKTTKTPAAESHFLCSWMVNALKSRTFSKLVANDLTLWIRQGRSMGAGANLKSVLEQISVQYLYIADKQQGLASALNALLKELTAADWLVIVDQEVTKKLKLDSDGGNSLIISEEQYRGHIEGDELIKPITLYIRANEHTFAELAYGHNLLLSPGNKKASLIKHHSAYKIWPKNLQPGLSILV